MSPERGCANYESGTDYTMELGSFRFRFSADDFAERVEHAAAALGFVPRSGLDPEDLQDLVSLAVSGEVTRRSSDLAAHVAEHAESLVGGDDDLVHWIRKLVFRGAWLDQQIKDGWLDPVFDESGFTYRAGDRNEPVVMLARTPDFSALAYRGTRSG
jgi:hypothetical protein